MRIQIFHKCIKLNVCGLAVVLEARFKCIAISMVNMHAGDQHDCNTGFHAYLEPKQTSLIDST